MYLIIEYEPPDGGREGRVEGERERAEGEEREKSKIEKIEGEE